MAATAARMKRMKRASGRRAVEEEAEEEKEDEKRGQWRIARWAQQARACSLACERGLLHLNCIISTLIFRIIKFPTR